MQTWSDKRCEWLALSMIEGMGNITFRNLLDRFETPERIFRASKSELEKTEGLRRKSAQDIIRKNFSRDPEDELRKIRNLGIKVITFHDQAYPALLKEIHDPPMVLYMKGLEIPSGISFIGIVGSRNPTHYGSKAAEEISQGLARRGLGIVSGMAKGIDSSAHWGCLCGKGFTVAVLGTGLDRIYPASNKKLYSEIVKKGVVLSEFPIGTPPAPNNFPMRNRIISGLSRGITVVEATKNSGSLITASLALDQGREVFAVPGSINSFKSTGCHFLIKQGARLIENSNDILDELGLNYPFAPLKDTFKEEQPLPLDEIEKKVLGIVGEYPMHIDTIAEQVNLEPGIASGILMKMELKGIIHQLPGKMFVR